MKRILVNLLIFANISTSCYCYADDKATPLNKGDAAPFTGLLLTPSQAQDVKNTAIERDALKAVNGSLNLSINLQDDIIKHKDNQITVMMQQNDNLSKNLYSERQTSTWEKAAWFAAGIITTGLVLYGVKNISK